MIKLLKYLKPFTLSLIVVVALLFGQAQCELALPDYMSDIINTGIQKSGIEDSVPVAIRENEYKKIAFFLEDNEKNLFLNNYELILKDKGTKEQKEKYPILKSENLYVLANIESTTRDKLNTALVKAEMLVSG
ncbi:MAG: ABC transporter ATP-binding protein, partial [Longicatena sp.]